MLSVVLCSAMIIHTALGSLLIDDVNLRGGVDTKVVTLKARAPEYRLPCLGWKSGRRGRAFNYVIAIGNLINSAGRFRRQRNKTERRVELQSFWIDFYNEWFDPHPNVILYGYDHNNVRNDALRARRATQIIPGVAVAHS